MTSLVLLLAAALNTAAAPMCSREPRYNGTPSKAQASVCAALAVEAMARGHDPWLVAELAWSESGWDTRSVNTKTQCRGPLQYQPRFWKNGWEPLDHYLAKHDEVWRGICDFKTKGTPDCLAEDPACCPRSKQIVRTARRKEQTMSDLHEPTETEKEKLRKRYGNAVVEQFEEGLSKGRADDKSWSRIADRLRRGETVEEVLGK